MISAKNLLLIFAVYVAVAPSEASLNLGGYKGEEDAVEKWKSIESMIKNGMKTLTKNAMPFVMNLSSELNLTGQCMRDGLHLFNGIRRLDPLATRFIDASGKGIDGIAEGTLSAVGSYDECVGTEIFSTPRDGERKMLYRGQYCTLDLRPPLPSRNKVFKLDTVVEGFENFTKSKTIVSEFAKNAQMFYVLALRVGICVPSGCTRDDISQLLNAVGKFIYVHTDVTHCEVKEPKKFTPFKIFVIFIFSATGFLVFVASMVDYCNPNQFYAEKSKWRQVLLAFSFFKNYAKLLKVDNESENLRCLNGIRFLTMSWIVVTHSYVIMNFQNIQGLLNIKDFAEDFAFQAIANSYCMNDTFFVIGGAVSCYVVMTYVKVKGHSFNAFMYIINRLLRILPVYIYLILFVFVLDLFGSGPFWHELVENQIDNCRNKWWYNFLFINNLYEAESMCANHTWYLACDFQFCVLALIVLLPLMRIPKLGVTLGVLVIVSSAAYCGFVTYTKDFPPTGLLNSPNFVKTREYFNGLFFRPYPHAGPYFIGLLLGYLLAMKPDFKIPFRIQVLCTILAFTFAFSTVYGAVDWNRGRDPTLAETLAYSTLSKLSWALAVAWLILSCATGHGGLVNRFLSWQGFVPLGRLSFMVYLVHPIVMLVYIASLQTRVQAAHFVIVWLFFGHLCVSFAVSFVASMFIEAPFLTLTKLMFLRGKKSTKNNISLNKNIFPIESTTIQLDGKEDFSKPYDNHAFTATIRELNSTHLHGGIESLNNEINAKKILESENDSSGISKSPINGSAISMDDVKIKDLDSYENTKKETSIILMSSIEKNDEIKTNENKCVQDSCPSESMTITSKKNESNSIKENTVGTFSNSSEINSTEIKTNEINMEEAKNDVSDPYDVKATYYHGLGWKLG